MVGTKAVLLSLNLLGRTSNYETVVKKELDYIRKYLTKNVFNRSVMEKTS